MAVRRNTEGPSAHIRQSRFSCLPNLGDRKPRAENWLLGLIAIGIAVLALPAAASACVSAGVCTGAGGTVETGKAGTLCSNPGGAYDQTPICSAGGSGSGSGNGSTSQQPFDPRTLDWDLRSALSRLTVWNPNSPFYNSGAGATNSSLPDDPYTNYAPGDPANSHLGMYVSPGYEAGGEAGGYGFNGKGVSLTDTSGALSGTTAPGFHGSGGGGSIYGSTFITPQLKLGGVFDYQHVSANFDGGGSEDADIYSFSGYLTYLFLPASYVTALVAYNFVPARATNAATGGTGSFSMNGFDGDLAVGHLFTLLDQGGGATRAIATKASPQPSRYGLFLDASVHGGYFADWSDSYTDSTGFIAGNYWSHLGYFGGSAKLEAFIPAYGIVWQPYIQGTIAQVFYYKDALNVPAQLGFAADTISSNQATTVGGGRLGISAYTRSGWEIGAYAFDSAGGFINIVGGNVFARIPLDGLFVGDSGIHAASK
jgi:hypothetical protein